MTEETETKPDATAADEYQALLAINGKLAKQIAAIREEIITANTATAAQAAVAERSTAEREEAKAERDRAVADRDAMAASLKDALDALESLRAASEQTAAELTAKAEAATKHAEAMESANRTVSGMLNEQIEQRNVAEAKLRELSAS